MYYAAYDMHRQLDERTERGKIKGVVAATENHPGNTRLIVSGEDAAAANHRFKVYFSDGTKMTVSEHNCKSSLLFKFDADREDVKIVDRDADYKFIPAFSLMTEPSGEERENLTPDEVFELGEKIGELLNLINKIDDDEDFLDIVEDLLREDKFPINPKDKKMMELVDAYRESLQFYK